ncbi:MAG: DegV family protein [Chloroflexota bacterium]|nr:DegV family protein [Chloroflexota bacterium]
MEKIVVVSDSTANLPPELLQELDIPIIPLHIHWGEETYLDGVTLSPETFYRWLQERKDFPRTSQPAVGEFVDFFREVAERYQTDTIVGVFISSDLSGTVNSALQAQAELSDLRIEVVDSRSVSMGAGFQVLAGARAARSGVPLDKVLAVIRGVRAKVQFLFTVDSLEYLYRGGRIGGAARFFGSVLKLKPLLTVEGGKVDALEKVRSRRKVVQRMLQVTEERLAGRRPAEMAVMDIAAAEEAEELLAVVRERFRPRRLFHALVAPVIGTHGGPGTLGLGWYPD